MKSLSIKMMALSLAITPTFTMAQNNPEANCKIYLEKGPHVAKIAEALRQKDYIPTADWESAGFSFGVVERDFIKNYGERCTDLIGVNLAAIFVDRRIEFGLTPLYGHARKTFYQVCQGNQYDLRKEYERAYSRLARKIQHEIPKCK